jgi:hypothetical protein
VAAAAEKFYIWLFGGKSRRHFPPAEFSFSFFSCVCAVYEISAESGGAMATAAEES